MLDIAQLSDMVRPTPTEYLDTQGQKSVLTIDPSRDSSKKRNTTPDSRSEILAFLSAVVGGCRDRPSKGDGGPGMSKSVEVVNNTIARCEQTNVKT
jgi:hypothetical protein